MTRRRNPFPGLTVTTDRHGRRRFRLRRGRLDCYLPGPYGGPEFRAAYEAALAGTRPDGSPIIPEAAPGTLDALIRAFYLSPAFAGLAASSRAERRRFWEHLRAAHGHRLLRDLRAEHVQAIAARKAETPHAANRIIKRFRQILAFGVKRSMVGTNAAAGCELYRLPEGGFRTWTEAEIAKFEARHPAGSTARLALRLMTFTGASRADLVRLGWGNVAGGRIRFRRQKTGGEVDLRILPGLAEELDRVPRDRVVFLVTAHGAAFTAKGWGNRMRAFCDAAGLPDLSSHGVRKHGATALALAGCSEAEIAAFLGHRSTRIAALYVKAAETARLSDNAFDKLEARRGGGNVSNLPLKVGQKGGQADDA